MRYAALFLAVPLLLSACVTGFHRDVFEGEAERLQRACAERHGVRTAAAARCQGDAFARLMAAHGLPDGALVRAAYYRIAGIVEDVEQGRLSARDGEVRIEGELASLNHTMALREDVAALRLHQAVSEWQLGLIESEIRARQMQEMFQPKR